MECFFGLLVVYFEFKDRFFGDLDPYSEVAFKRAFGRSRTKI